ncbi:MAG: folate-binding protein [Proteobacteria bacterium]|uniref:CAF17-like 4Fe-4S cluster assembly/insertion protein YgfZ n=1 Tax=Rudaea sp. TaxID=2136325 RepID=UPI003783D877|nr:folate-binding protein [Pseudomonadota bacterium]
MTSLSRIALPAAQIVELAGADAIAFAQAQFSSNLAELENGHWQWSAWLSAQGRVRAFFHLLRDDDEHLRLILRGTSAAGMRDALARYVLRAKATLRAIEPDHTFVEIRLGTGSRPGPQQPWRIEYHDGSSAITLPGTPQRRLILGNADEAAIAADASQAARNKNTLADIAAGIVSLAPTLEDKLLPAWIGLDALAATSTNKGCYPGQEIVARLHFKGGNKRRLHRIRFAAAQLPEPGTPLGDGGLVICSARINGEQAAALAVLDEHAASSAGGLVMPGISLLEVERVDVAVKN